MTMRAVGSVLGMTLAMVACGGSEPPVKDQESMETPKNTTGADRVPGGPGAMVTATTTATTPPPPPVTPAATATATAPAMSAKPQATGSSTTTAMMPPGGAGGPCDKCVGKVTTELQTALTKRAQDSRSCYVKVLTNNPTAKAGMNIEIKVGRDGTACESQAHEEDPKWPGLADCVLGEFKKGGFPTPGGAACVVARVPIAYTPAK